MQKLKILVLLLSFATINQNIPIYGAETIDLPEEKELIFEAIKKGNLEELKFLVEILNLPLTIKDDAGNTPLDLAMKLRKKEIINYLRSLKKKIKDEPIKEETLFEQAAKAIREGNLTKLKSLFAQGLKITDTDKTGNTLRDIATIARKPEIKKYLIEKKRAYDQTQKLIKPEARKLFEAIADNNLDKVKQLIESGEVSPNAFDHNKSNPLHYAILFAIEHKDKDNKEMIAYLISKGTQNTENALGYSPTGLASKLKRTELLKFIQNELKEYRQKQAEIKKEEKRKKEEQEKQARQKRLQEGKLEAKDLEYAIEKGEIEIVKGWLAQGGDIEQKLKNDNTPLLLAIKEDQEKIVKYLLENDANINAKNENDIGVRQLIKEADDDIYELIKEKLKELRKQKDKLSPEDVFDAINDDEIDEIQTYIDKGGDIEITDELSYTPLLYAIKEEKLDIAKLLVKNNANLEAKDDDGSDIEDLAEDTGDEDIIEYVKSITK